MTGRRITFSMDIFSAEEERDGTGYLLLKKRNCTLSD
jgi:hypothetical protein